MTVTTLNEPEHTAGSLPHCGAVRGRPSSIERKCFGLALFVGLVLTFAVPSVWAQCAVLTPIAPTAAVIGTLAPGDCVAQSSFVDLYRVTLPALGTLDVLMTSNQIDSLLILLDENAVLITFDDDSGGGLNARMFAPDLPAGTYIISAAQLSLQPETGSYTLSTTFTPFAFTITATAGAGGTISPQGSVPVNAGFSQTLTITPNSGFSVSDVLVDGVSVGAVPTFTFSNVDEDHTIQARFFEVYPAITPALQLITDDEGAQ